jgi:membrane dipeptidase
VPHHRQFADDQLKCLIERGAVIGLALDAWMLVPNWVRGTTTPQQAGVTLDHWADHIDHVCQLAGNARHAGIGSDLDGAFGREQTAADLDTIADLGSLAGRLRARGYGDADVDRILSGNFLGFLRHAWRA